MLPKTTTPHQLAGQPEGFFACSSGEDDVQPSGDEQETDEKRTPEDLLVKRAMSDATSMKIAA